MCAVLCAVQGAVLGAVLGTPGVHVGSGKRVFEGSHKSAGVFFDCHSQFYLIQRNKKGLSIASYTPARSG